MALGGASTNWDLSDGLGGGHSSAFPVGLYGHAHAGPAYLAGSLAYASHWMSTERFAFAGDQSCGGLRRLQLWRADRSWISLRHADAGDHPYATLQAQSFHTPSYSETNPTSGGFGLSYASRSASDARSELGARFDTQMAVAADAILRPSARVAWQHDWVSDPSLTATFQALPGASFIVNGAVPAEDTALVSTAAELRLANGVSLLARFDGDFGDGSQTYAGTGTLRYAW